ncbi:MAG: hypothetical protein J7L55_02225 [Desulfurococcales archaeon]|nr:hypothetical protein [Desulfurococcales archaeon]
MKVSVPLHVSGFWIPYYEPNPYLTGSVGAGIILNPPLRAELVGDKALINGREANLPHLSTILQVTGGSRAGARIKTPAGLGEGFGVSAAVSLAFSLSSLHSRDYGPRLEEAGLYAHYAEVMHLTGLGDVIAELRGGDIVVRVKPGAPGIGKAYSIKIRGSRIAAITGQFRNYTTPQMLRELAPRIRRCGNSALSKFMRNESIHSFLEASTDFSLCTGMLTHTLLNELKGQLKPYIRRGSVLGFFVKKGLLLIMAEKNVSQELVEQVRALKSLRPSGVNIFRVGGKGVEVTE